MLKKSIYLLPLFSLILVINGCSSTCGTHAYNNNFGLLANAEADRQLEREELTSKEELQKFNDEVNNMREFTPEEGTFLDGDWIKPNPIFSYLYPGDPKFYREDELPKNKGRLGNVIVKVPNSMTKEQFLLQLESGTFRY